MKTVTSTYCDLGFDASIGAKLYESPMANLDRGAINVDVFGFGKRSAIECLPQYVIRGTSGSGKTNVAALWWLHLMHHENPNLNQATDEFGATSIAPCVLGETKADIAIGTIEAKKSEALLSDTGQQFDHYLKAILKYEEALCNYPWHASSPLELSEWFTSARETKRWQWFTEALATLRESSSAELSVALPAVEETPSLRAQRLLSGLETDAQHAKPLGDRCGVLARLAALSGEVRELLWKILDDGGHPQIQWLAMDVLAKHDWDHLPQLLVERLAYWDQESERAAVLGAVLTVRQKAVPAALRTTLLENLRKLLSKLGRGAREGTNPLQTELLVQTIATFGAFATTDDLKALRDFWSEDCAFDVSLTATKAATRVVARYVTSPDVECFFSEEALALTHKLQNLAEVRSWAIENGTMLWTLASLLLARLGPESKAIVELGCKHPKLAPKLLKLASEAETTLRKLGHDEWLGVQNENLTILRESLSKE